MSILLENQTILYLYGFTRNYKIKYNKIKILWEKNFIIIYFSWRNPRDFNDIKIGLQFFG